MPNNVRIQTVHLGQDGDPDTFNVADLPRAGELGARFDWQGNKQYQIVQLDSGTGGPTPAATQILFWKDKSTYLVTNDSVQAIGGQNANSGFRNEVAGILRVAATRVRHVCVLQRGQNINVLAAAGTYVAGDNLVANTGTAADGTVVAAGTALTVRTVGIARGARAGGVVATDVDIPQTE